MPTDAMAPHQGDEILLGVAAEGRDAEGWIGRQELRRRGMKIGEVAAAAAGNADLLARRLGGFQHQSLAAALTGNRGTHHARRTRANDNDVPIHDWVMPPSAAIEQARA